MTATVVHEPAAQATAWCSRCKRTLPAAEFGKDKSSATGLHCWCLACCRTYQKARRAYQLCGECGQKRPPGEFANGCCAACQVQAYAAALAAQRAARIRATVQAMQAREQALHLWYRNAGPHPDREVRLHLEAIAEARAQARAQAPAAEPLPVWVSGPARREIAREALLQDAERTSVAIATAHGIGENLVRSVRLQLEECGQIPRWRPGPGMARNSH